MYEVWDKIYKICMKYGESIDEERAPDLHPILIEISNPTWNSERRILIL